MTSFVIFSELLLLKGKLQIISEISWGDLDERKDFPKCNVFQVHQPKYFIFWDRRISVIYRLLLVFLEIASSSSRKNAKISNEDDVRKRHRKTVAQKEKYFAARRGIPDLAVGQARPRGRQALVAAGAGAARAGDPGLAPRRHGRAVDVGSPPRVHGLLRRLAAASANFERLVLGCIVHVFQLFPSNLAREKTGNSKEF